MISGARPYPFTRQFLLGVLMMVSLGSAAGSASAGWVITTDYSTFGRARQFQDDSPWGVSADLATIPGDASGRFHQGLIYIVGRGTANTIQIFDPQAGFSLVREFSVGAGRNPQDIAFAPDGKAYVTCYDQAVLLRIDVDSGTVLDAYDTSGFADADGIPETGWLRAHGGVLFITAQLLDRGNWYAPTGPGSILVFDTYLNDWVDMDPLQAGVQPIILLGEDPYTDLEIFPDGAQTMAMVGCVGSFGVLDGGIELVNLGTGMSMGNVVTEAQLGGDVTRFMSRGEDIFALVSDVTYITSLRKYAGADGSITVLDTGSGYVHADLTMGADDLIYVADRTLGASGLRVFDAITGLELTTAPVATGLPPFQFVTAAGGEVTPVPGIPGAGLKLSPAYPNPCNPAADLVIEGMPGDEVRITVCDLKGRKVSHTFLATDERGLAVFRFTGKDEQARLLAAGVYRVTVQQGGSFAARSVTLIK